MQAHVFKPRRRIDGQIRESRFYSGKIRMEWWLRAKVFALHTNDRRAAERKLQTLVDDFEKERNGLLPPMSVREAIKQPLWQHLEAFMGDLTARRRGQATIDKYRSNLTTLFKRCEWTNLRSVNSTSFLAWRNACTLAPKSVNDMLANAMTFFRWLEGQGMLAENPLCNVKRVDTRRVENFRRALTEIEAQRFLEAAPRHRAVIYLLAMNTGMRRKEMALLTWGDFDFTTAPVTMRLPSSITKNAKQAQIYLRPEVVQALQAMRPRFVILSERVFRAIPRPSTIRRDLAAAGVSVHDEKGRRVDLHALRVTYGTNLSKQGVHPRVAMELMRHSDIKLTMRVYTDASQLPLAAAVASLPAFTLRNDDTQKDTQKHIQTGVAGCVGKSRPVARKATQAGLQSA